MREEVVTDELWARLEPLIPVPPRRFKHPGRKRVEDRAVIEGILYSVRVGIGWNRLPAGLFGASGATCWRRLAEWQEAGVWQRLHETLLAELRAAGMLDLSAALVDSTHLRALKRGEHVGPSPVDRGKLGSKHHLITDAHGTPLAVTLTGGNRNDVTQLIPLIDAIPPIRSVVGKPKQRPRRLYADRGYDHDKYRRLVRARGITPHIARRGVAHGSGLGVKRWPVERTFAWLKNFRRLRIRTERRADVHQAILSLACSIICLRKLILN
ncbi:IS5 family transposase [Actinokineospora sp. PR83]|uniref:IS5 family transposase n=1 Tax=Actinokineospora sp. PR83 TaxID=2884908 RepID=UPI0027E07857|nr:IS5 family transposase [Actinokineospora sp. PR83]MCG8920355.1 IS5 family transposase [Actinokineospora sp. PR83]